MELECCQVGFWSPEPSLDFSLSFVCIFDQDSCSCGLLESPSTKQCNMVYVWFLGWLVSTPSFLLESFCHSLNTTSFVPDFAQGPAE